MIMGRLPSLFERAFINCRLMPALSRQVSALFNQLLTTLILSLSFALFTGGTSHATDCNPDKLLLSTAAVTESLVEELARFYVTLQTKVQNRSLDPKEAWDIFEGRISEVKSKLNPTEFELFQEALQDRIAEQDAKIRRANA